MPEKNATSQTIEELQARFEDFKEQKLVVEVQKKSALEKLNEIKKEALDKWGSDDLDELKSSLKKMKKENEQKRARYQKSLDDIEQHLVQINEQFVETELEEAE